MKNLLRKIVRKLKRSYQSVSTAEVRTEQVKPFLVFVFGGRTQYWPGMGKELYEAEPVFRQGIQECARLILKINGVSILENFEQEMEEAFFDSEAKITLTISAIQIALYDLWKSKGIVPDAIMGVSSGEAIASYAAGAINLEDVLRIFTCSIWITELDQKDCITLFLFTTMEQATALCKASPLWVAPVYDAGAKIVLLYCKEDEVDAVIAFFSSKNILCKKIYPELFWPFHTDKIRRHEKMILELIKGIITQPTQIAYYSSTLAKIIPANSIIAPAYLYDTLSKPVLINPTVNLFREHQNLVMIHLGPAFFLKTQIQNILIKHNQRVSLFDSLNQHSSEMEEFQAALRMLTLKVDEYHTPTPDPFSSFLNKFSLSDPEFLRDPYPTFRYLRSHGSVHHLPLSNTWLVLDFDDISEVLKKPEFFSSKILSGFDSVLIGTDPPEHTLVRNLLQPYFSPKVFEELGHFASAKARELLAGLAGQAEFEVVDQFSLPMAQAMIAHFLGVDEDETLQLKNLMKADGHTYHMNYLKELELFFEDHLKKKEAEPSAGLGSLINSFVQEGKWNFEQAVLLMRTLWIAGMTTTSMLLSSSIKTLMELPEVAEALRHDEKLIPKFIEECLRLEAPESELTRITIREVSLGGQNIPEGAVVILSIRAANRDALHYPDPDVLSLSRAAKRHLSFGGGYHYCLGIGMARTEALHTIKAVLEQLPNLRKANRHQHDHYFSSPHFRGLETLWVTNKIPE